MKTPYAKAFLAALDLVAIDHKKFKRYLEDKRMTVHEKVILRCWLMLREGDYKEILVLLPSVQSPLDDVLSQKEMLMGSALINVSRPEEGIKHLKRAIELLEKYHLPHQLFVAQLNLTLAYLNLKDATGLVESFNKLVKIPLDRDHERMNLLRARFNFACFFMDHQQAALIMDEIEENQDKLSESQRIFLYVDYFNYYIKQENFERCEWTLEKMKNHRRFQLSGNFTFMRKLLTFVTSEKPLYLYLDHFPTSSIQYHQVKCLLALEGHNQQMAKEAWQQLHKTNPTVYRDSFNYQGDKCLFSLALNKLTSVKKMECPLSSLSFTQDGIEAKLVAIFIQLQANPIGKEDLFRLAWGHEATSKQELHKLTKWISRLRERYGLEFASLKNTYSLKNPEKLPRIVKAS